METQGQTKKELGLEAVRFLLVGVLATLVDYFCYFLFREWVLSPDYFSWGGWNTFSLFFSTAIGFSAGLIVNWLLSVRFVFRQVKDREKSSSKFSFFLFTVIGVFGLFLTEIGMHAGALCLPDFAVLGMESFLGVAMKEWVTKAVMTCIVLFFNYFARKRLIFKS